MNVTLFHFFPTDVDGPLIFDMVVTESCFVFAKDLDTSLLLFCLDCFFEAFCPSRLP